MSATDKPNYARGKVSSNNLAVALAYIAKHPGRKLFPTIEGKSRPAFKNNLNLASNDPEQLKAWQKEHERRGRLMWACSPRVCEPPLFCLDPDMGPRKVGRASLDKLVKEIGSDDLGSTILDTETNSTPSGGLHLIFEGEHKFSAPLKGYKDLDVPNYFMIPGQARTDGERYSVVKDIAPMPAPAELQRRVKPPQPERSRTYTGDAVPLDLFKKMLAATPYTGGPDGLADRHSYSGCLNFLMAAHEAAGGDESDYLELVIDWCLDDPNPDWKEPPSREWVERKWCSFNNSDAANAVTRASWFKVLDSLGRGDLVGEASTADDLESFRADPANDNIPDTDNAMGQEVPPREYANGYDGDGLEDTEFPPQEEIIEGLLLEGTSQTIDGDGGVGKSLIGAQMAVHRVSGMLFLGRKVKQGPCIFITHEDDYGEVKKRMKATAKNLGLKDLRGLPLYVLCILDDDITVAEIADNGKWKQGPFYQKLDSLMASMPGAVVFLDCLTDIVQGNLMLRPPPNTLYKVVLNGLAKKHGDATPVVLAHPSKASMESGDFYEGSTANRSAVRRKLVMKLANKKDPDGPRFFGALKNNYGANGKLLKIVFNPSAGIFVLDSDPNLTAETVAMYETIVGKIVKMIRSGLTVVKHAQADGHGPEGVARAISEDGDALDADGIAPAADDVRKAMEWGERKGRLRYIRADKNRKSVKAHYEIPKPGEGDAAADFKEA